MDAACAYEVVETKSWKVNRCWNYFFLAHISKIKYLFSVFPDYLNFSHEKKISESG